MCKIGKKKRVKQKQLVNSKTYANTVNILFFQLGVAHLKVIVEKIVDFDFSLNDFHSEQKVFDFLVRELLATVLEHVLELGEHNSAVSLAVKVGKKCLK